MFSILFYILLVVLLVIYLIATFIVFPLTVPFDRTRHAVHEISRSIAMLFFRLPPCWKTRVEGVEHVDPNQTYVIVLNHSSMVDIPMLYWLKLDFRWVAKGSLKSMPFFGRFMWLHGDILIPTDQPRKAATMVMTDGLKWLRRGVCISIFPEGTRSKTGEIGRFKAAAFTLAKEAGVPILPVVLDGSNTLIGKYGMMPWRHNFTVKVLPPVSKEEIAAREPKEIMDETRERMIEAKFRLS